MGRTLVEMRCICKKDWKVNGILVFFEQRGFASVVIANCSTVITLDQLPMRLALPCLFMEAETPFKDAVKKAMAERGVKNFILLVDIGPLDLQFLKL